MASGGRGRPSLGNDPRGVRGVVHAVAEWVYVHLGPWLVWIGILGSIGASVFWALFGIDDLRAQRGWILPAAIMTTVFSVGVGPLLEYARRVNAAGVLDAKADRIQLVRDVMVPVGRRLRTLHERPSNLRAEAFGRLISDVLNARSMFFDDRPSARMVIYVYTKGMGARRRRMHVVGKDGRPQDEPNDFVDGDGGRGSEVFAWLDSPDVATRHISDCEAEHGPDSKRSYSAYVSVPVRYNQATIGLLTFDVQDADELSDSDDSTLEMLAIFLATGMAMYTPEN